MTNIEQLRARIDELDEQLVELLIARTICAVEIGRLKQALGIEVYQPEREAEVLEHVRAVGSKRGGPLGAAAITRLFERIIDEARRIERQSAGLTELRD
jgi:chorismate mutase